MKEKLFPGIVNYPEFKPRVAGLCYFLVYVFFMPALVIGLVSLASVALDGTKFAYSGLFDFLMYLLTFGACMIINFLIVRSFFHEFLSYSFLDVRQKPKTVFKYVLIGLGVLVCAELIVFAAVGKFNFFMGLPLADPIYGESPAAVWYYSPVIATILYLTIVPITMSCLYYGTVFGHVCENHPLLAYVLLALLSFVPHILSIFNEDQRGFAIAEFVQMLPLHFLCAWVYEKTDTIWASIFLQIAANVCGILLLMFAAPTGFF